MLRILSAILTGLIIILGCPAISSPAKTSRLPIFELRMGEKYFRVDGRQSFVLGRNPAGISPKDYDEHFRHAAKAGERFMRIHFTYIPSGEKPGEIDAGMLSAWDAILDSAEKYKLAVLPVLGVWADWNDGSKNETWHRWDSNPYNIALGGPAKGPDEVFDDTLCRKLWLKRLETFIKHWSQHRCIVGWEIFSELDLVTSANEERAVKFTESAAEVIRAADAWKRPITASQAGVDEWPKLLKSNALDFIEIHPYSDGVYGGKLDELILSTVRQRLSKYNKPVLVGECGLSSAPPRNTLDAAPRAEIGIRNAIWASIVSGAMNGRMLWWQDGCDQFEKVDLCSHYNHIATSAAAFVYGVDYTGFKPVACVMSDGLMGAMIGNDKERLGWFRDTKCNPPDWPVKPISRQTVTLKTSGKAWKIEFMDTVTGKVVRRSKLAVHNQQLRILLPEFKGSIAVHLIEF